MDKIVLKIQLQENGMHDLKKAFVTWENHRSARLSDSDEACRSLIDQDSHTTIREFGKEINFNHVKK